MYGGALMTRLYRANKWKQLAADLKPGQVVRLHYKSDVTSLYNAITRRGERMTYKSDQHGYKAAKVDR